MVLPDAVGAGAAPEPGQPSTASEARGGAGSYGLAARRTLFLKYQRFDSLNRSKWTAEREREREKEREKKRKRTDILTSSKSAAGMDQDGFDVRRTLADEMGGRYSALADDDRAERMIVSDVRIVRAQWIVEGAVNKLILFQNQSRMLLFVRKEHAYAHA